MVHTKITADGRKIRFDDLRNTARAYIRRGDEWARASMKDALYQVLLIELKEEIKNKKPEILGLVRNIKEDALCPPNGMKR